MTKENIKTILDEYGVPFTDALSEKLWLEFTKSYSKLSSIENLINITEEAQKIFGMDENIAKATGFDHIRKVVREEWENKDS